MRFNDGGTETVAMAMAMAGTSDRGSWQLAAAQLNCVGATGRG